MLPGYGDAFGHSTGHGIGLEIHEGPNVSFRADKQFVPGNVITDEPGIYLPGIGGVRIEDDLLITAEGNRVLTHAPKRINHFIKVGRTWISKSISGLLARFIKT